LVILVGAFAFLGGLVLFVSRFVGMQVRYSE